MEQITERIAQFIQYVATLAGDEKGESQVFLDRLFQVFGHDGYKEAGATLEHRVRSKKKRTKFADLLWERRVLIEMKKRGAKLESHRPQVFDYWWDLRPNSPKFVILCNFDEFWIYDFTQQDEPLDKIGINELPARFTALNFLFKDEKKPHFQNNLVNVTREAAAKVAHVFNSIIQRGEQRERAQRFILQCVLAMFSEDTGLLPIDFFTELLEDCLENRNSYDLIGGLFRQMNSSSPARGGRFQKIRYFDGGLFNTVEPVELTEDEIMLLREASGEKWSKIQPPIFGELFQGSMDQDERHAYGAHFTYETDIYKVIHPTIVKPWRERIDKAKTLSELLALRQDLLNFHVLDPACGSGNFLYVAFRELKRIEMELLHKLHSNFESARQKIGTASLVTLKQFHGIDNNAFAVELAKVTLMLAKEIAIQESQNWLTTTQEGFDFQLDSALPLENLDGNIKCDDALFCEWPKVQAIIGNPPYQSKNKMQQEYGAEYVQRIRQDYPDVPGRADYCVYWFRRAHDELPANGRAGLVGTNTIRQNYSRKGGLEYIVGNGGTITEAVSTQVWPGDAVVHVSIVNWTKGEDNTTKSLFAQIGDSVDGQFVKKDLNYINASLSAKPDLSKAKRLDVNRNSESCYQGQTHGHEGFLVPYEEAQAMIEANQQLKEVLFPYLTAREMLNTKNSLPNRFVIDFHPRDMFASMKYETIFNRIKEIVLPSREAAAAKESERNEVVLSKNPRARVNHHHANFLRRWWLLSYAREELIKKINAVSRYIVCGQVTKRPIFEFIHADIRPNAALIVFPLEDDYSFGILQSNLHWEWFTTQCSTLKGDYRYTSDTVFDTFPWPQNVSESQALKVAKASSDLRQLRQKLMNENNWTLRALYRTLDLPGANPLRKAHEDLDNAVRAAYGMKKGNDVLDFLLNLNLQLAENEVLMKNIVGPGLPPNIKDKKAFITDDYVKM